MSTIKCVICLYEVDMLTAFERGLSNKKCDSHKWHEHVITDGFVNDVIVVCSECGVDIERIGK